MTSNCPNCGIQMHYERRERIASSGKCVTCEYRAVRQPLTPYDDLRAELDAAVRDMDDERADEARRIIAQVDFAVNCAPSPWLGLEQWLPNTTACAPSLPQFTTVTIGGSAMRLVADPTLKRDECYLVQGLEERGGALFWSGIRVATAAPAPAPPDPLDVEYDGRKLSELLSIDEAARREDRVAQVAKWTWTPAQRAAVSAYWSAELRAKIAAAKERDRNRVTMEHDE